MTKGRGSRVVSFEPLKTMTLHTIADVFQVHLKGYSQASKSKKPVSAFKAKKGGVCFEGAYMHWISTDMCFKKAIGMDLQYTQICRRCQRQWWQIATDVNDTSGEFAKYGNNIRLLTPECEVEGKHLSLCISTTPTSCPDKTIKTFLIADFFHLPRWCTLSWEHTSPWMF